MKDKPYYDKHPNRGKCTPEAIASIPEYECESEAEAKRDLKEGSESGCDIPDKLPSQEQAETSRTSPATSAKSGWDEKSKTYSMSGNLFLTAMKHVVLDNHNNERFAPLHDRILMTAEELRNGINARKLMERLVGD